MNILDGKPDLGKMPVGTIAELDRTRAVMRAKRLEIIAINKAIQTATDPDEIKRLYDRHAKAYQDLARAHWQQEHAWKWEERRHHMEAVG